MKRIVNEMAKREGITEQLKAEDMMTWVKCMNNVYARAREIVNTELIYIQNNKSPCCYTHTCEVRPR